MSRSYSHEYRSSKRRGSVAIEAVITLAVVMLMAMGAYKIGVISCGGLYHVISSMVGSFY